MSKVLVSGLVNVETTVKIPRFPMEYTPINYNFFGVSSTVSGVGLNVAKALNTLGDEVILLSLIGKDLQGDVVLSQFNKLGIDTQYLKREVEENPQSVVIYDDEGRRHIETDLKDIQHKNYNIDDFRSALNQCDIAVLCNINFSRPFLKVARYSGKIVATDVHTISHVYDEYNSDFMKYANILFMSNENIGDNVEGFIKNIINEYHNDIIVVGLGSEGALLYVKEDNFMGRFKAINVRKVVNTVGAGDSMFSAFVHYYGKNKNPYEAIKKAIAFASYKIGAKGAADGFLKEDELEELYSDIYSE